MLGIDAIRQKDDDLDLTSYRKQLGELKASQAKQAKLNDEFVKFMENQNAKEKASDQDKREWNESNLL